MQSEVTQEWTADDLLALGRSYQGAAVLAAAAELDLFSALLSGPRTAERLSSSLRCDRRGMTILLDALTSLGLLEKAGDNYRLPPGVDRFLTPEGPQSILAMAQHQANCLRNWSQLAMVVKTGCPAEKMASVRGEGGAQEAFIGAMHNISAPQADAVIQGVQPLRFNHLLDIGGASGTWTMAFLRACPSARATLFDLPNVIPMARRRLAAAGMADRIDLVSGDFLGDPFPGGADLVWVSAIIHQNSRAENRLLFGKVFQALVPGGRIAIRDIIMAPTRTSPIAGALFAVNMLVATPGGGTFTFEEVREDLEAEQFIDVNVARQDEGMNSVVLAHKP